MNKELEQYYAERFEMMTSQGWNDLVDDAKEILKSIDSIDGKNTVEQLFIAKGEKNILTWLINLKDESSRAYEGLKNESD